MALYELACRYETGDGVRKNIFKAVSTYKKAAENGSKTACRKLASLYKMGTYVEKDFGKSAYYSRLAGDDVAAEETTRVAEQIAEERSRKHELVSTKELNLGLGAMEEKDYVLAVKHFEAAVKAADKENGRGKKKQNESHTNAVRALFWLGTISSPDTPDECRGPTEIVSAPKAIAYFERALRYHSDKKFTKMICENLAGLYLTLRTDDKDNWIKHTEKALAYFRRLVNFEPKNPGYNYYYGLVGFRLAFEKDGDSLKRICKQLDSWISIQGVKQTSYGTYVLKKPAPNLPMGIDFQKFLGDWKSTMKRYRSNVELYWGHIQKAASLGHEEAKKFVKDHPYFIENLRLYDSPLKGSLEPMLKWIDSNPWM